ncbi:histidine phosphatase family protein [Plantactinospora veratri]|uniref:Histidine phosphatase family protein n=1 Tax=Plantactinospora veratri TaxID=1436122 RepID=A0ABU7SIV2_9ACTN
MRRPEVPGRSLVLLRHAKAERPTSAPDADRPLTARGHADAAAAGAWLGHGGYLPTVVLCSPAKRTRQTWHDVALGMAAPPIRPLGVPAGQTAPAPTSATQAGPPGSGAVPAVRYDQRIYHGHAADLLELVRGTDPAAGTLLLIGHNPAISELSTLLDPVHADPEGLRTSGIVIHRIDGEWADVAAQAGPIVKWHTARG